MKKILLFNSSTHDPSNSAILAKLVLKGLDYQDINLNNVQIGDVQDFRFASSWPRQDDDYYRISEQLQAADVIVLATPVYWYGVAATLKRFIDRWSESLKVDDNFRAAMQGKQIVLVIVGGDNPIVKGQPIVEQFNYICEFLGMELLTSVIGEANRPNTIQNDSHALSQAEAANTMLKKLCQ
ncbi:flavodoxin family protein [Bombilactobacillus thymidiniphilus]|uniref:Flavodoxin family protein n=1 Tax=Bombilactobacillus thymidiniphilus TaxID=2923363 RepID=A0ABY4PD51_9LACO|nr:flavodoxin family protein [Bombilactobacillus thymidiniphilus]UQS83611.1 flavodoxin family protein [Bombilactobacillus thymidiniphilus]UQS83616.1 flavodoxin family protein [Bombilactobacillus thymidiniphilus]UQS83631.1 flavodoxin family protein [Bombilactobacillus thymidiniphilus]UQS83636.1 flavodoxin family protein [Bombilactobacillus thymidiniphilus]